MSFYTSTQAVTQIAQTVPNLTGGTNGKVVRISASGYNLLISGYLNDSFSNDGSSIYVETDIGTKILGKSSSVM